MQAEEIQDGSSPRTRLFGSKRASESDLKSRLFLFFTALTAVDALQTLWVISRVGSVAEANPVMRLAIENFGAFGLIWIKAFSVFLVFVFIGRIRVGVLACGVLLMAGILVTNLVQLVQLL